MADDKEREKDLEPKKNEEIDDTIEGTDDTDDSDDEKGEETDVNTDDE